MPTFARGQHGSLPARHITYRDRVAAARALATDTPTSTSTPTTSSGTARYAPDPMTVRGIPAVGRNCPGHIAGTQPENQVTR
jgi:hypothetical protein